MLRNVTEVIEKAKELIIQEQFDQAERELLLGLNKKIDTKELYFLLGDVYLHKNALKQAEITFKKVVSLDPQDYLAYLNLGHICLLSEDLTGAEKFLSLVLENSSEYREFVVPLLGEVYFKRGNFYEAYHHFEAALKITPEDEDLFYKAGLSLIKKGLVKQSRELLEKILKRNPKYQKINHLLASLKGKKNTLNNTTIEESSIKSFKLLKQYFPEPASIEEKQLNETFADNYRKNLSLIQSYYPQIYEKLKATPDKLDLQIIPIIDGLFDLLISRNGRKVWMYGFSHPQEQSNTISSICEKHTPICLVSMGAGYELKLIFKLSANPAPLPWMKIPLYVVEPSLDIFKANLMMHDLSDILQAGRVFFFLGDKCLEDFYQHLEIDQTLFPEKIISVGKNLVDLNEKCVQQINKIKNRQEAEFVSLKDQINTYYNQLTDQDWAKIYSPERTRPLRVLGVACRFTTFLKYCMRDVANAFEQLGCEILLLRENSDVSRLNLYSAAKVVNSFKPDLIFLIDHSRSELLIVPENIPCVNWVQDELDHLFNTEVAKEIGSKDLILCMMREFMDDLARLGYPKERMKVQVIPVNHEIYKPIHLNHEETKKYCCDVAYVQHGGTSPEQELTSILKEANSTSAKKVLKRLYIIIQEIFISGRNCFKNDYPKLLEQAEEEIGIKIEGNFRKEIIYRFRFHIGNRFLRQIPLETIAEMGVDLKLYGRDWENHPRLSKYAQGIAHNGEELNKIFNGAKINLQLQHDATLTQRFTEGAASASFFLVKYLDYDLESISDHFEEGSDFVFFRNLNELREKIIFYLKHDEERKKIGKNAYQKIITKYTYKAAMKQVLEIISKNPNNITT